MRVLVTGANGHIGCNLLPILIEEGHEVVPFVREGADTRGIDGLGLTFARGDVLDGDALGRAAEGCDAIIHMAAVYSMSNDPEVVMAPAIEGSKNVVRAATSHGIGRIVYTSSTVSIGKRRAPVALTEADWADDAVLPYAIAKRDSERAAARLAAEAGVDLIILNPTGIYGRWDLRLTPSNAFALNWLTGRAQTVPGGTSVVDVRDVALAHARALTRGAAGERHILCAANLVSKELGARLKALFGVGPLYMPAPRWVLIPATACLEALFALVGKEPPYTRSVVKEWAHNHAWFDGSKAERVFDFKYRDTDETLIDAVSWLAHQGRFPGRLNARLSEAFPPEPAWGPSSNPNRLKA